jgi:hypothetical protein
MFLARRPSPDCIDRFLRESQDLPLSYEQVGVVVGASAGGAIDHATVTIGRGPADFARARSGHSAAAMRRATRAGGGRA